jgi:hypothetical protein
MNAKLISALILASVSVAPAFAANDTPPSEIVTAAQASGVTRADVKAQMIQLEQCGYRVGDGAPIDYPLEIQAAEACVAAKNGARDGARGL